MQNIPGGTIIDNTVTKEGRINFFLQAQSVNQGTANPVHYDCIFNEMALSEDLLKLISYQLTFLYSNWAGPVKVPSVC